MTISDTVLGQYEDLQNQTGSNTAYSQLEIPQKSTNRDPASARYESLQKTSRDLVLYSSPDAEITLNIPNVNYENVKDCAINERDDEQYVNII